MNLYGLLFISRQNSVDLGDHYQINDFYSKYRHSITKNRFPIFMDEKTFKKIKSIQQETEELFAGVMESLSTVIPYFFSIEINQ